MAISCKMKMDWYRETKFSSHIMLKTFGETDMDERCRVFTPLDIAEYMLDIVGYKNAVYGKKIVENSCGAGNILCAIVKRYIESLDGYDQDYIRNGLQRDIVGFDIDEECCEKTRIALNKVAQEYGITDVEWRISCANALLVSDSEEYDFVVGNPPYISYRSLDIDTRIELRENFESCRIGAFDYCYAFIEHALASLKPQGKMIYLIPSSIFKNVHGKALRDILKPHLVEIYDYTSQKLFGKVLTSSALISCVKDSASDQITYIDVAHTVIYSVSKQHLGDKWRFASQQETGTTRFGEYFKPSIVIATLLNSAFVVSGYEETDTYIIKGGKQIERSATKNAVSPRLLRNGGSERIIFPYEYSVDGELLRYSEEDFIRKFPYTVSYLQEYKEKLLARDADSQAKWFEYGRSQALKRIHQEKLLISTIVTGKVEVYKLNSDDVPYAGIIITPRKELSLDIAKSILESDDFYQYVQTIGTYANGSSIRITPKDIENFEFDARMLQDSY